MIKENITELLSNDRVSQQEFNEWHYKLADSLRTLYIENGVEFYYGQAQKWINMTLKYLYVLGEVNDQKYYGVFHATLDNYIFNLSYENYGILPPKVSWSRIADYDVYLKYQEMLKGAIGNRIIFEWKFDSWMEAAKKEYS